LKPEHPGRARTHAEARRARIMMALPEASAQVGWESKRAAY
jgi:hypothetical protein